MTMEQDRDGSKVDQPSGEPPDAGLAYDPDMTDTDEANIPPDSDADPDASEESQGARSPRAKPDSLGNEPATE
jgi:hypothetical protein